MASFLHAQVGNDNPTGPAGVFNGNVNTGCSYDPYTGNASRSITDLAVSGSAGAYPLAFARVANSRANRWQRFQFAGAGAWRHSYTWEIDDTETFYDNQYFPIESYNVHFPDGRVIDFTPASGDSCFRGAPGISERFQPTGAGNLAYLILPDGGKVEFLTISHTQWDYDLWTWSHYYSYRAQAIIDPYGQRTNLIYNSDGSLNTIQEPGGRWIQLVYVTTPWVNSNGLADRIIDHVRASDGRVVQYSYGQASFAPGTATYTRLGSVTYFPSTPSAVTAYYTYQAPNVPDYTGYNGQPLLATADDPMYAGPMKKISYTYATGNNQDGSPPVYGQILSENSGTTGQLVSTLAVNGNTRTENRGDGPSRTFNYSSAKLVSYTDFKGQTSSISYDGNGYTSAFTDSRGNTTTFLREGTIGAMSVLTHPDQSIQGYAYWNANGGPYYLQIRGDERGHNTYFSRDGNFRLTRIDYPDYPNGAYEEFTYNGLNQVLTHRLTGGGTQAFAYDDRHNISSVTDALGNVTYYYYDDHDRGTQIVDPNGNSSWFQYNERGQLTRVTHADNTFVTYAYDSYGNRTSTTDELGHTSSAAYDDYGRILSVTNALNQTTSYSYAQDWVNSYVQTTSNPKGISSPMGKGTHFAYDANWQRTILREAPGTADDAWTWFGYDAVGNLAWQQDPRGNTTNFAYDNRNRRTTATDPLNQTTTWQYDAMNNLTRETRPDQSFRRADFDSMNRVVDSYGFGNEHTHYGRDLAGNVTQLIDAKNATYYFGYDLMNRKTSTTYPADVYYINRMDNYWYDGAGNLSQYQNPAGQYQHFSYDNRNRRYHSWWDGGAGQDIVINYDVASRLTSVVTNSGETTVTFGYDDANRQVWEEQTLAGYPARRVNTPRDVDGNRSSLEVPGRYYIGYGYNQRNQLASIGSFANFNYDAAGNMTSREGVWGYANETNFAYDELNRVTQTELGANGWIYARSHYQYDSLNRQVATWRDEQSSKGERFGYNAMNQLTSVSYNADQVWTGNAYNPTRTVSYNLDALNRQSVNENGTVIGYSPDGMNQYTNVGSQGVGYDGNFNITSYNGASFSYDAENHLVDGSMQATYDGLGRCVRRTVNGNTRLFTYDGWKSMLEWDQWGNFLAWNVYGAGPDEILVRGDATYGTLIYKQDHHGNVVGLLDGGGNIIEKYTYDAFGQPTVTDYWGNVRGTTSWYGNRFMFQGREWISELGIYDFRNRMYQPSLGRFLQTDPTGFGAGDMNLFRYCGGDPVNHGDPFGMKSFFGIDLGAPGSTITVQQFRRTLLRSLSFLWIRANGGLTSPRVWCNGCSSRLFYAPNRSDCGPRLREFCGDKLFTAKPRTSR